jgi:hypothetical protein
VNPRHTLNGADAGTFAEHVRCGDFLFGGKGVRHRIFLIVGLLYDKNRNNATIICMTTKKSDSKRGRPELESSERKSVVVQFRVTPDESRKLEHAAESGGKRLSDWLRERTLAAT